MYFVFVLVNTYSRYNIFNLLAESFFNYTVFRVFKIVYLKVITNRLIYFIHAKYILCMLLEIMCSIIYNVI